MRPLGRTQSAPLPLGHPLLQGVPPPPGVLAAAAAAAAAGATSATTATPLTPQQFDIYLRERQFYEQQQQHNLMKQQLRQSVLTRAGSRSQVENVEEETEAAVAREMMSRHGERPSNPELIDLTEHRLEEEAAAAAAVAEARRRDGLPPLRVTGPRASIQPSAGTIALIFVHCNTQRRM